VSTKEVGKLKTWRDVKTNWQGNQTITFCRPRLLMLIALTAGMRNYGDLALSPSDYLFGEELIASDRG